MKARVYLIKVWMTEPIDQSIYVFTTDNTKEVNDKIESIKQQIVEKAEIELFKNIMSHELLFIGRLLLNGYLIAIECSDKKLKDKLEMMVQNYKRNVKIIDKFDCTTPL